MMFYFYFHRKRSSFTHEVEKYKISEGWMPFLLVHLDLGNKNSWVGQGSYSWHQTKNAS